MAAGLPVTECRAYFDGIAGLISRRIKKEPPLA